MELQDFFAAANQNCMLKKKGWGYKYLISAVHLSEFYSLGFAFGIAFWLNATSRTGLPTLTFL